MKRKLIAMLSFVLALILMLGVCLFSACGGDPEPSPEEPGAPTGPETPISSGNEEVAIRALFRGLTTDFSNAQANVRALGKIGMGDPGEQVHGMNVYALDADLSASYDDDESTVMMFDGDYNYGLRGDTADLNDAMAQLKDDPMNSTLYYVNGKTFEKYNYGDSYYMKSGNAGITNIFVDGIFNGAWISDINELFGIDIMSDWTFESLKEDIGALTVGKMLDYFEYIADKVDKFIGGTNLGEMSLSDIFDALAGITKALGVDYSRGGDLYDFLHWLLTDSFKICVTENDQGSTLTVEGNEIVKHVLDFAEDFRAYKNGSVDDAIKSLLNIDCRKTFDSVKNVIKGTMTLDDILGIVSDVASDYKISYDQIISFIESIAEAVTGNEDVGITEKYKAYTVDEFIREISDNELDYASCISTSEEYMDRYLGMPFGDFLAENSLDKNDQISLLLSLTAEKADVELNVNFDKNDKLTGITANTEVCFEYDIEYYHMHFSGAAEASISGFGSTAIDIPAGVGEIINGESPRPEKISVTRTEGDLFSFLSGTPVVLHYETDDEIKSVAVEEITVYDKDHSRINAGALGLRPVISNSQKTVTLTADLSAKIKDLVKERNISSISCIEIVLIGFDGNRYERAWKDIELGYYHKKISAPVPDGYNSVGEAIARGESVTFTVNTLLYCSYNPDIDTWEAICAKQSEISLLYSAMYIEKGHVLIMKYPSEPSTAFEIDPSTHVLSVTVSLQTLGIEENNLAYLYGYIKIDLGEEYWALFTDSNTRNNVAI